MGWLEWGDGVTSVTQALWEPWTTDRSLSMTADFFRMESLGHRVSVFLNLLRYHKIALQGDCANLHSYQESERISVSP